MRPPPSPDRVSATLLRSIAADLDRLAATFAQVLAATEAQRLRWIASELRRIAARLDLAPL